MGRGSLPSPRASGVSLSEDLKSAISCILVHFVGAVTENTVLEIKFVEADRRC